MTTLPSSLTWRRFRDFLLNTIHRFGRTAMENGRDCFIWERLLKPRRKRSKSSTQKGGDFTIAALRLVCVSRVLKNPYLMSRATNLECADNGGALDLLAFCGQRIQGGVALRLPPHSKLVFQRPVSSL